MAQLIEIAFSVFNNHDLKEKREQNQCEKKEEKQVKLIVLAVSSKIGNIQMPQD